MSTQNRLSGSKNPSIRPGRLHKPPSDSRVYAQIAWTGWTIWTTSIARIAIWIVFLDERKDHGDLGANRLDPSGLLC